MPSNEILKRRLRNKIEGKKLERQTKSNRQVEINQIEKRLDDEEKRYIKINKRERTILLNRLDQLYLLEDKDEDNAFNAVTSNDQVAYSDKG